MTSVRLNARLEALVGRLAKRRGWTKSEVIREALMELARRERRAAVRPTPYEAMAPTLGCARGGPKRLSERTGERFARRLYTTKKR